MINQLKKIQTLDLVCIFMILFFAVEALNKVLFFQSGESFFLQKAVKICSLLIMLFCISRKSPKKLFIPIAFTLTFFIGQLFLEHKFEKDALVGFGRYTFFLVCILFTAFPRIDSSKIKLIKKVFESIIILNSVLIILGFIFKLEIFETYRFSRFGYNGLFMASAHSTYFYIISFIYYSVVYHRKIFSKIGWWLAVIACLFIGTKSLYLVLLLLSVILTITLIKKRIYKIILALITLIIGLLGSIWFFSSKVFSDIIEKDGWVSAILSYRDQYLLERTIPYINSNWNALNYLFGGIENPSIRPQIEIIDIFLFVGILGTIVLLLYSFKFYFTFKFDNKLLLYCFLILLAVVFISGNFFYNANTPIYLVALKCIIINEKQYS